MGVDEVMNQVEAWKAYDTWRQDGRILFHEEPPKVEESFRAFSRQTQPEAKTWADSYLAAFATVAGMQLVTFDRAFKGKIENLLILKP